jgi:hypothetical protein
MIGRNSVAALWRGRSGFHGDLRRFRHFDEAHVLRPLYALLIAAVRALPLGSPYEQRV